MGSTPTSINDNLVPWSNGNDTCVTCRRRWFNSIRDHCPVRGFVPAAALSLAFEVGDAFR